MSPLIRPAFLALVIVISLPPVPASADEGGSVFSVVLEKLSAVRFDRGPASRPMVMLSGLGYIPGLPNAGVPIEVTAAQGDGSTDPYATQYCAELARLQAEKKRPDRWRLEVKGRGAFTLRESQAPQAVNSRYEGHLSIESCRLVEAPSDALMSYLEE